MMKLNPFAWVVILVFAAIIGVGLLGGNLTGQTTGSFISFTSGTVLSVIAAVFAIGVLIIAGLKQNKE